jgi:micrococcal nuclease
MYEYKATIIKVYDGDTVTAIIDLGFNVSVKENIRLARINTPEVRGDERPDGLISRDRLSERILNQEVIIKTNKDKKGKYGRYIGEIILNEENLNDWLVTEGLAEYRDY